MVDEVASISEETAAETDTVAAAAEEQTSALTEVSASASDLANQAVRLSEALDRFETDVDLEAERAADLDIGPDESDIDLDIGSDEASEATDDFGGEADEPGAGSESSPNTDVDESDPLIRELDTSRADTTEAGDETAGPDADGESTVDSAADADRDAETPADAAQQTEDVFSFGDAESDDQ